MVQLIADAELVARSRRRDAGAFGELVERHQQLVFGVALARCHDVALAEDVAQEAFVAAWRDLDRLRDGERVGSWVAGIARNLAAAAVRTRTRREGFAIDASDDSVPTPEDEVFEREDRDLLARALAEVPDAHRETLVLFYLEGESIAGIATALGITEDLVKQRLSRGRRALRDSVESRVESALTRARLRPVFRVGVVAAITALGARQATAATAGKAIAVMTTKQIAVAVVAVGALVGGVIWWTQRARPDDTTTTATTATTPLTPTAPAPGPGSAKPPKLDVQRLPDRASRTALVDSIRQAHERRARSEREPSSNHSTPIGGPPPALVEGTLDKQYIRAAVRELIPLISECYEELLERQPALAGTLVVDFTIEGEAGVGAVISETAIDAKKSDLRDPTMHQCIQETMYALKIDQPPTGGVVHVSYPFAFRPAPPDDEAKP
ncbi:MAG: sigma-70 family RNA polymerase sigma factor [Kofleriaceae bacterium]